MRYISTRGAAPELDFAQVTEAGLASDGGLYLPKTWPRFSENDIAALRGLSYAALARRVMRPFIGDSLSESELAALIDGAYAGFDDPAVTPLKRLDERLWVLELFHGPTLAFKDVALQFLGLLFDLLLKKSGRRATVVGATSGDTGSAAIAACAARANLSTFILYPQHGPSEIQRRQMTCVDAPNVHALAIDGSFDACQAIVKALFKDQEFRAKLNLTAVNSINWARILAQIVYYFAAALQVGAPERSVSFVVPTGNFGNIFAGYAASKMGLPLARLVAATNRNDAVHHFFMEGAIMPSTVVPTLSPSMDIQVPSNLERLLFDLADGNAERVRAIMQEADTPAGLRISKFELGKARQIFTSTPINDLETLDAMAVVWRRRGMILDPHSAVGVAASDKIRREIPDPIICLACAHPAKFPETVYHALDQTPPVPDRIKGLLEKTERTVLLPANTAQVKEFILQRASQ